MENVMEITLEGQQIELLPEKALFWKEKKALIVSDLHLGKTTTFRRAGIAVSDQLMIQDLDRLQRLLTSKQAQRCIIVGDFLHHPSGLTETTVTLIGKWLEKSCCPVELILGNHDRGLKHLNWPLAITEKALLESPFAFSHIPCTFPGYFTFSGHVHPKILISKRRQNMRLPCFLMQKEQCLLPAFSSFAGGHVIVPSANDQVFAIAEDTVIKLN
ncbi:hypothetical protein PHSC3_001775 [Chlamydiales bacterium STE3]|nr:hypothetical protein PHSC3_001775 [Chlamydiales bacterium STE3]